MNSNLPFCVLCLALTSPSCWRLLSATDCFQTARLQIYRHHVLTSLTDVLQTTFPVICRLVDERFFRYAADAYLRQYPPEAPCLFEYGAHFPAFLATFPPCRHLEYLTDVARLEWAMHMALHAEVRLPLDPAELGGLAPHDVAQLVFQFDPSVTLLDSPWPIDQILARESGRRGGLRPPLISTPGGWRLRSVGGKMTSASAGSTPPAIRSARHWRLGIRSPWLLRQL